MLAILIVFTGGGPVSFRAQSGLKVAVMSGANNGKCGMAQELSAFSVPQSVFRMPRDISYLQQRIRPRVNPMPALTIFLLRNILAGYHQASMESEIIIDMWSLLVLYYALKFV